ncbi:hypothetical protein Barb6XT_01633 [Bacteroidales bacterium Barb6XT]|nr:hypothetical protein Barb6XT_01633 [Bacteroidales bacterium Barb6XT]
MTRDYIPSKDQDWDNWIYNLIEKAQKYKSTFNIPEKVLTDLVAGRFAWSTTYISTLNPATRTPKLIQAKIAARKALEGLARDLVQGYLVHSKEMTDEIRVDFDLRIPRSHSTIPRPSTAPSLAVHSIGHYEVEVVLSTEPEGYHGKPEGVSGYQLWTKDGDPPVRPENRKFFGDYSNTRQVISFDSDAAGLSLTFIARWLNAKGQTGPWSNPVTVSIS